MPRKAFQRCCLTSQAEPYWNGRLDLINGTCFSLDPVSYVVWNELTRTGTSDESIRHISETSGVEITTVKADIEELLRHLIEVGLIEAKT